MTDELEDFLKSLNKPKKTRVVSDFQIPKSLAEYIGQKRAKSLVRVTVDAALTKNSPFKSTLISGSFGQGKSALARIMADMYKENIRMVDAATVTKDFNTNGIYIIDEIHNLPFEICDSFNISMDAGKTHLIGCTTSPGKLPSAFKSRFREISLEPYTPKDMVDIISGIIARSDFHADSGIVRSIATRGRLTPRIAINYLSYIFDVCTVKNTYAITSSIIKESFEQLGVDINGFTLKDYAYMKILPNEGTAGMQYIASMLGMDQKTIEEEIEPYLMQSGLVMRTPKGRRKLKSIEGVK